MNFPEPLRNYVLIGVGAAPDVIEALLEEIAPGDPVWDFTPDPQRFSLRAVIAHLADWNGIFLERIIRTRDEEEPKLPDIDEGQIAVENEYAASNPHENISRFRASREILVQTLKDLDAHAWGRTAHREWGTLTIVNQAALIMGHDGYHTQQIVQWLEAAGR